MALLRLLAFVLLPIGLASCSLFGVGPTAAGCPGVDYPDWEDSPYVLPYPVGDEYFIGLSTCSGSYHSFGRPDAFAIDFNMPIGSLITASRAGTVVHIETSGEDYAHPNNLVVIEHSDDTFAQYMHLTRDGTFVEEGDEVARGDSIGLSGATGLAGYPHLHFVVTRDGWRYPYSSTPVTFRNTVSNPRSLASGYTYTAHSY